MVAIRGSTVDKKELAEKMMADKPLFHGSITIHFADGKAKKLEIKEVQDLK
jgi:hypothetical protein